MLRLMLSLTLALLLAVTGAASDAQGLGLGEAGHHAMEDQEEGHGPATGLDACCDATGAAGGSCLIDATLYSGPAHLPAVASRARPIAAMPVDLDGRIAAVPTGPPKV